MAETELHGPVERHFTENSHVLVSTERAPSAIVVILILQQLSKLVTIEMNCNTGSVQSIPFFA